MSTPFDDDAQKQADGVVAVALDLHHSLPAKAKPSIRSNGVPEWTILACIVLVVPSAGIVDDFNQSERIVEDRRFIPISLGTGVKCLPATRLPPLGDAIHDSHAEIVARRGFVRWLLDEASRLTRGEKGLGVLEVVKNGGFRMKDGVGIWLYVSALPCGDASTLHTAAYQPPSMAALKASSSIPLPPPNQRGTIRGRNGYESFGSLRTKPGRADSVPSISLSCSDKIATWCVLGLTGGLLTAPLPAAVLGGVEDKEEEKVGTPTFEPVYLTGIVVGGVDEFPPDGEVFEGLGIGRSEWRSRIKEEVGRALQGRIEGIKDHLPHPYHLRRPAIYFTDLPFQYSKSSIILSHTSPVPAALSILHLPPYSPEQLFNGCTQHGSWKAPGNVLVKDRGRSMGSKYEILKAFIELRRRLFQVDPVRWPMPDTSMTYHELKHHPGSAYQRAKEVLRGTPQLLSQKAEDKGFAVGFERTIQSDTARGDTPFAGWIVCGKRFESFNLDFN